MKKSELIISVLKTFVGTAIFALSLNLFLLPNELNTGGISGLAMVLAELLRWTGNPAIIKYATVGILSILMNLPLFAAGGLKIGKRFFFGSLLGMTCLSVFIDLLAFIPAPETESLVGALYGGVFCGIGGGLVFSSGFSTGGSVICLYFSSCASIVSPLFL